MIRKFIYNMVSFAASIVFLVASVVLVVSCHDYDLGRETAVRNGFLRLSFTTNVPVMDVVNTRGVDPDGGGIQDITLFCFDSYGLFITTTSASLTSGELGSLTGTFVADVPENTRMVHFIANQNMSQFKEDAFRNKSETDVLAQLEGSSGRMIYWARFSCNPDDDSSIAEQMTGEVRFIRNHAQIAYENNPAESHFVVTGFACYNVNAFGTVAPFHPLRGFNISWPDGEEPFVTLPTNPSKLSDVAGVTTNDHQYVFESSNSSDDPVSVIIRGHKDTEGENADLYYRVMLVDADGEQLLIRRNHKYILHIVGALSYGQQSFADATTAAATNNVWISISNEVNEVEDMNYILNVERTSYVVDGKENDSQSFSLDYSVKGKNGRRIYASDKPVVQWISNNVARQSVANTFEVAGDVGSGRIDIQLLPLANNEKLEGTLLVKKGRLQRKIKIITVHEQQFVPAWVGTQVYGSVGSGRSHVTLMFTIPDNCPQELFPMTVLLSVDNLDIRSASGMTLPVIRQGEEGYGQDNGIGYKYVYRANAPGVQRVYFENILNQVANYRGNIVVEAEHFRTLTREFSFSDTQRSITVASLNTYNAGNHGGASDEVIYYRLVPQKKHAPVQFDVELRELANAVARDDNGTPFNAEAADEFMLFSKNLNYYVDGDEHKAGVAEFACTFYPDESLAWSKANDADGGRMLMFKPRRPSAPTNGIGRYPIYMYTRVAKSAEVVCIASNQPHLPPVLVADGTAGTYSGGAYRNATFELANANPFRFAAQLQCNGAVVGTLSNTPQSDNEEVVSTMQWSYRLGQDVYLSFDITSFRATDGSSFDPFGEPFDIFIDAPMLELGDNPTLGSYKLYADSRVPGRFVYRVDASRDVERSYFAGSQTVNKDATLGVSQVGERKTLHFKTKEVVSAGDIMVSSDEDCVVFFSKIFRITNQSITGTLQYKTADGTVKNVPRNAFVAFERVRNGSRIGALSVVEDGSYELRLRKEYDFNWHADEVEISFTDDEGNAYITTYGSLEILFHGADIVLNPVKNKM